jgi:hypothetical protein
VREDVFYDEPYLMFDPAISPHYEVFLMLVVASWAELEQHSMVESEWPPSRLETSVFSSRTGCWEERLFVREGNLPEQWLSCDELGKWGSTTMSTGARHSTCIARMVSFAKYYLLQTISTRSLNHR